MIDINNLQKLKVPELKKELEDRGVTKLAGLLKADLVEKLKQLLEQEQQQEPQQQQQQQPIVQIETTPPPPPPSNELPPPPPPPPSNELPPPPPSSTEEDYERMETDLKNKIEKEKEENENEKKVEKIFENEKREKEEKEKINKVQNILNSNKENSNEQIIPVNINNNNEQIIKSNNNNNNNNNSSSSISNEKKRTYDEINNDITILNKNSTLTSTSTKSINNGKEDNDDEDDEFDLATYRLKKKQIKSRKDCPYLDTVDRSVLDFDFEKICSISFHNHNVYACLVCGKYFQGKSQDSHANYHCLQTGHHVFINLKTQQIYCLPDDYEVIDSSLDDIKYLLNPTFTKEQISELDKNTKMSKALDGSFYLPGIIGLNNLKNTSYVNVIIQSLARIPLIRDYLLDLSNIKDNKSVLVQSFSELLRKIWNPRNFKPQVSPHEVLQAIQNASQKKFNIRETADPLEFLQWFLNNLHKDLGGTKSPNSSIIYKALSGQIQVTTQKPIKNHDSDDSDDDDDNKMKDGNSRVKSKKPIQYQSSTIQNPFLFLTLDLPQKQVFKEEGEKSIIPQVPLFNLLSKYDGHTTTTMPNGDIKTYKILQLPKYLILCIKRFSKNNFFVEKEPTIVNFPIKNLDLSDYLPPGSNKAKYNLLATIKHEGEPTSGNYSVYVNHKGKDKWFEMLDLTIKETMPQLIAVSECYFLIYEKINM